ncbi:MAG: ABC transporter ATP-binding protein [Fimbriimonadia bacterium]|jgi:iron complex transport system ATP-binding protein
MLRAESLACGYAKRQVVADVGLELRPGELLSLIGPNGVGKSTLLRTLTGYLPALSGRVMLDGRSIHAMSAAERGRLIAYVPQSEPPVFDFTVREVVRMGRTPHGDEEHAGPIVDAALDALDLIALRDRPVTQLSGGELQRTLIARALAQDTPLMLLDEPTAHLDLGYQARAMSLLRTLCERSKRPVGVLCVLQDLNLASEFSDRVALLVPSGSLVVGSPEDILSAQRLRDLYGPAVTLLERPGARPVVAISRHATGVGG